MTSEKFAPVFALLTLILSAQTAHSQRAIALPDRIIDGVSYTHLSTLPRALIEGFASSGRSSTVATDLKNMASVLMKYAFEPKAQTMARQLT